MTAVFLSGAGVSEMAPGMCEPQFKMKLVAGRTCGTTMPDLGWNAKKFFSAGAEPSILDRSPPVAGAFVQVKSSSRSGGRSGKSLDKVLITSWQATKAPNAFQWVSFCK